MVRQFALLLGVLAVLLAAAAVVPHATAGAHPPVPLCGGCTGGFEDAAAAHDTTVRVEYSEVELDVHENATVTGEATLRVNERAAERFRENDSLLDAVAVDAFVSPSASERSRWAGDAVVRDVEDVDASITDRRVTVSFVVPDGAREGVGGVVYTELLRQNATVGGIELQVDRATVTGPADAVLVRAPGDWGGDGIVFQRTDESRFLGYGGYLAWASDGGPVGQAAATASIWLTEARTEYPRVLGVSGIPAVLAGAIAGVLALAGDGVAGRLWTTPSRIAVGYGAATVGLLAGTFLALAWLEAGWLGTTALAVAPGVVVAGGVAAVLAVVDDDPGDALGRVPTSALYGLPVFGVVAAVVAVAAPGTVALVTASASVGLVGALGVATTRGPLATAAVVVAIALAPVCLVFPALSPSNFPSPRPSAWIVLVVVAGLPLFALGRRSALVQAGRDDEADTNHATVQR